MTQREWLDLGYEKHIINEEEHEEILFKDAYKEWFLMKLKLIKEQSCDRIEVTYNRYYLNTSFVEKYISQITHTDIIDFLNSCLLQNPMTYKEFARCIQIVNNVLVYFKDMKRGGAILYDWDVIRRYLPIDTLDTGFKREYAVSLPDIYKIMDLVINYQIYSSKQNQCLCLCMNFFLGLRIGELASLTFRDFDFDRGVVKVYKTESKSYSRNEEGERVGSMVYRVTENMKTIYSVREIPILPEVRMIYDKIKEHHDQMGYDSPYLAYDGHDAILSRSLDRTLRKLCQLCDVDYFNSHAIRKTFGTMLHYAGVPTRVISDLMGHSEISTTEHCYILSFDRNYSSVYNYMKGALKYAEDSLDCQFFHHVEL